MHHLNINYLNFNKYKLNNRCFLIHSNWATAIKSNYFDIIICNPPYIDEKYINNLDEEVMIMKGSSENIKITFQEDLKLAKTILLNHKRIQI